MILDLLQKTWETFLMQYFFWAEANVMIGVMINERQGKNFFSYLHVLISFRSIIFQSAIIEKQKVQHVLNLSHDFLGAFS